MSIANRARVARRQAAQIGLRLSQHGELFTLRDQSGSAVFHGAVGALERYLDGRCLSKPTGPPPSKVPAKWRAPIALFVRYLEAMGRSPGTIRGYRLAVTRLARELRCAPDEVTEDKLIAWFARHQHWTPETRRGVRSAIRVYLAWAHKAGWMAVNLADAVPATRIPPSVARPVPDAAFIEAVEVADRRTVLMMRLAAEAGLRRGEVAKLSARDVVDGPGGAQLVVCGKGGRTRVIPISDDLAAEIRRTAGANGFLFPGKEDGHLSPHHVGKVVAAALPPGWSMHKLRHRFATRAFRYGGRNILAVQQLLGHSSVATTQRYTAVDDDEIRAAALAASFDLAGR